MLSFHNGRIISAFSIKSIFFYITSDLQRHFSATSAVLFMETEPRYASFLSMSNPPALLLRVQVPTSYLAREPSAIPTPPTTVSRVSNHGISQWWCCVRVRGVCFFHVFGIGSGPQSVRNVFSETPATQQTPRGVFLRLRNHGAPGEIYRLALVTEPTPWLFTIHTY